jgi:reverse gyrase
MKTHHQIQSAIDLSSQLPKFDLYPAVIECWNERELMWRTDNGRSYAHIVETSEYQYHLMYFNERLAIVERDGVTIFSHLTDRLTEMMSNDAPTVRLNRDRMPVISVDDLAELCKEVTK